MNSAHDADATPVTLARLRELFDDLLALTPTERAARLDALDAQHGELAQRLRDLLAADSAMGDSPTEPLLPELAALRRAAEPVALPACIGRYVVDAVIGSGGMGTVYRAHAPDSPQQPVAIKRVRADLLDAAGRRRFDLERAVLATLSHPTIARLLDAATDDDGTPYVVLEYVEGVAVIAHADQYRLDLRERLLLFLRICAGISHAHSHRIVHRDLKSSNILVTAAGLPKVLDFGIAKPLRAQFGLQHLQRTATAQRFFSPHNAAPEQLTGDSVGVGCDVYGLGVILYELLCGELPLLLSGLSPGQIENTILYQAPLAPSQRVKQAPPAMADARARLRGLSDREALASALHGRLDRIVLQALHKQAGQRHATVEELARAIRDALAGRRSVVSGWHALRRGVRRYRLSLALVTICAVPFVGLQLLQMRESEPATAPVMEPLSATPAATDPTPAAAAIDKEMLLALVETRLDHDDALGALNALSQVGPLLDPPDDNNRHDRVRYLQYSAAAAVELADFLAADDFLARGNALAESRLERAALELVRIDLLQARGRMAQAQTALLELEQQVAPYLDPQDLLLQRIRAQRSALSPSERGNAATTTTLPTASALQAAAASVTADRCAGDDEREPGAVRRAYQRCIAQARSTGQAATQLVQQVAFARWLNRQRAYAEAVQVLDAGLEEARADADLKRSDTYRVGVLTAAVAHYGEERSDDRRERLGHELSMYTWLVGASAQAEWNEQAAIARSLGVDRAD